MKVAPLDTIERTGQTASPRDRPLNRIRAFVTWPHFNPGVWLDTNPCFVRLDADDSWAVFTRYAVPPEPGSGSIWVVRVDARLQPIGIPAPLIADAMDPRVVRIGQRVLVFYAVVERDADRVINGSGVMLAEFDVTGETWTALDGFALPKQPIQKPLSADATPNWEKNWVPFEIDSKHVGLIYAHDPWDVMTLSVEPGQPRRLEAVYGSPPLQWDYGTIRGGTPPVRYDDRHLVTFFHASQIMGSRNVYSVGACVFLDHPPYTPVWMTAEPLLVAPYRTGASAFGWGFAGSVVFPLGCERGETSFRLLCGSDDSEIASFVIAHEELRPRLSAPNPGPTGSVHDYRGGGGVRLPLSGLLYVPDPIPGVPELPMINFLRMLVGRGRTFVDAGAHIGFYSMALAPRFDRVISYEPSRFQFGWLRRNALLNAYDHVQCEHVALGEIAGRAALNVLSYEGGLNSLDPEVAEGKTVLDQYAVPVEVLDDRGLTDVDLLKIDVEGFEIPVLRGAAATVAASRPVILIEVWDDLVRRQAVRSVLAEMGYSLEFLFPRSPELAVCLPAERRQDYAWFI